VNNANPTFTAAILEKQSWEKQSWRQARHGAHSAIQGREG